jgi:hypothetical protein
VKEQLLSHGLQLEEFGGDVQAVEISALTVSGTMGNLPWATYRRQLTNILGVSIVLKMSHHPSHPTAIYLFVMSTFPLEKN